MAQSMTYEWIPVWPPPIEGLLPLAISILLAALAGEAAARFARLPRITGYSIVGMLVGGSGLGWFGPGDVDKWRVVMDLALALLLFELGIRVDLKWFRANPILLLSSLAEALMCFIAVFAVMQMLGAAMKLAAAVAAISMATSPAIVMRVASELRASGQVCDRMITLSALNAIYAIVATKLIIGGLHGAADKDWLLAVAHPLYLICGPLLVAVVIAGAFKLLRRVVDISDEQGVAVLFGLLLLGLAVLTAARLPALMAPLLAGIVVKNTDPRPHLWPRHFGTAGGVLVILLFVMTGVSLTWDHVAAGGLAALALIAARSLGKASAVLALGRPSGLSLRQSGALALALCPMSDVAVMLTMDLRAVYPAFGAELSAIVFSAVVILELAGPVAVQWALRSVGEAAKER